MRCRGPHSSLSALLMQLGIGALLGGCAPLPESLDGDGTAGSAECASLGAERVEQDRAGYCDLERTSGDCPTVCEEDGGFERDTHEDVCDLL